MIAAILAAALAAAGAIVQTLALRRRAPPQRARTE